MPLKVSHFQSTNSVLIIFHDLTLLTLKMMQIGMLKPLDNQRRSLSTAGTHGDEASG